MRKCITPATISITAGCATALVLIGIASANSETNTSLASQYFLSFANLATQNTAAALTTVGCVTTALFYTYIAKPIGMLREKCCKSDSTEANTNALDTAVYQRV